MVNKLEMRWAFIGLACFCVTSAVSKEVAMVLFKDGRPVHGYTAKVDQIEQGGLLQFSNGVVWPVERLLDRGDSSVFFASKHKAIRIARFAGHWDASTTYQDLLNEILDGYGPLVEKGVPVVEVFIEQSVRGEFVVEEELLPHPSIGRLFSLSEYLEEKVRLSESAQRRVVADLAKFLTKASGFAEFGDPSPKQLLFTQKGWKLADYRKNHILREKTSIRQSQTLTPFGTCVSKIRCFNLDLEL